MWVTLAPAAEARHRGRGTGQDGTAVEEAVEVVGQRGGVGVAAVGLLLEAFQADRLQVAHGTLGWSRLGGTGSRVRTRSTVPNRVTPWKGGRPVSSS